MGFLDIARRWIAAAYVGALGPCWGSATVPVEKFRDYAMNAQHPDNRGKAAAFAVLGWNVGTVASREAATADVVAQLRRRLPGEAKVSARDQYGVRYSTETPVVGPNGRNGSLFTAWMVDHGRVTPRLLTTWLKVHV